MEKMKIAVVSGGWSREREVSLKSGRAVLAAMNREKYRVMHFDPRDDLDRLVRSRGEVDLAFVLLHGRYGEDGCFQGFLNLLGIPFVGSGVLASAMALNKKVAKEVYRRAGLTVAQDRVLNREQDGCDQGPATLPGLPAVVKPVSEGSSIGVSLCRTQEELALGLEEAFRHDTEVLVEEYVEGRELTCCVVGNRELETLPLIEIIPDPKFRFFDYEAKYTPGATREVCPAPLTAESAERIRMAGKAAHRALGCSVWSRTDMIVRKEEIFVLETNTIPGMTENSLFPLAARVAGLSFPELVDRLIALALEEAALGISRSSGAAHR
jgi:D-alanine-D-alanine ligase